MKNQIIFIIIIIIILVIINGWPKNENFSQLIPNQINPIQIITTPPAQSYLALMNPIVNLGTISIPNPVGYVNNTTNYKNTLYKVIQSSNSIIVFDLASMGNFTTPYVTVLLYNGKSPGQLSYNTPTYTTNLSSNNIQWNSVTKQTTIQPNTYYLIWFIPIPNLSTNITSISGANMAQLNNTVININQNFSFADTANISFGIYILNSSSNPIVCTWQNGTTTNLNPNQFYYINNNSSEYNGWMDNHQLASVRQYGITKLSN